MPAAEYRAAASSVQSHHGLAILNRSGATIDAITITSHVITIMNSPAVASTSRPVRATMTGRTSRFDRPRRIANPR